MSREEREKLSDVLSQGNTLFPRRKVFFNEAFPTIESLSAEVVEKQTGPNSIVRKLCFSKENFPSVVNCTNSLCYGGGVNLGDILYEMVAEGETEKEKTKLCQGHKGSPKGRRSYGPCMHYFSVRICIKYKINEAEEGL